MDNATSNDALDDTDKKVPITALKLATLDLLSSLLNPPKYIPLDNGLFRSWIGLATLCGIQNAQILNIEKSQDPTRKVLQLWIQNNTVDKLLFYLDQMDRSDIIDDITPFLEADVTEYKKNVFAKRERTDLGLDNIIVTTEDSNRIAEGLDLLNYDAFVLYAQDDIDFATELIETMEKQYDMKFVIKDRDLNAGLIEYDAIIKLITQRCDRLIVILSPAFFESPANKFFLTFAQSFGIEQCQRKVIPCIYKPCDLPPDLRCCFLLDYRRAGKFWNFWDKLRDSIRAPTAEAMERYLLGRSLSESQRSVQEQPTVALTRPFNHVKFSSMVNLSSSDPEPIVVDPEPIVANSALSSSSNSLRSPTENSNHKTKLTKNWLKKLIPKVYTKSEDTAKENGIIRTEKEKKRFTLKMSKRKVALAN